MVLKTKPKALIHSAVAFAEQLRITCRNHLLWAYNERHLLLLEKYIQAKLRQSQRIPKYGWHNQSLFSRLLKIALVY
ncbi:hypothetical protein A6770_04925 [Nostoc minutum NIES-26]|uniref:Uncharacterized protein n=1 Tax=Nostoc minutum NIES-26 TaxID=1844469 RepID=A0A367QD49_9NOSO|nr:hypothetical protein A6770_04925 [Nostoc minutum NIES-26]